MYLRYFARTLGAIALTALTACATTNRNVAQDFTPAQGGAHSGLLAMSALCSGNHYKWGVFLGQGGGWSDPPRTEPTEGWVSFTQDGGTHYSSKVYVVCNQKLQYYMLSLPEGRYSLTRFSAANMHFDLHGKFNIYPSKVSYVGRLMLGVDEYTPEIAGYTKYEPADLKYFKRTYKNIPSSAYLPYKDAVVSHPGSRQFDNYGDYDASGSSTVIVPVQQNNTTYSNTVSATSR